VVAGSIATGADEPTNRVCLDFFLNPHSIFFNANPVQGRLHGIFLRPNLARRPAPTRHGRSFVVHAPCSQPL
jgi:hypothetical protein